MARRRRRPRWRGVAVSGGTSSTRIVLTSGGSLSASAGTDMSRLHLDARGAVLAFVGAGNRIGSVLLDGKTSIAFGMSAFDAWASAAAPTLAQATAARNEVWRKAGLAAA